MVVEAKFDPAKSQMRKYKKEELTCVNSSLQFIQLCDSGRIQTCNLLIRSQMLYSVELRSQKLLKRCFLKADAKVRNISESTKFNLYFLKLSCFTTCRDDWTRTSDLTPPRRVR